MLVGRHGCRQIWHGVEAHHDWLLWGDVLGGWTSGLVIAELLAGEVQRLGMLSGRRRVEGALHRDWAVAFAIER